MNTQKGFIAITLTLSVSSILLALVAANALDSALFYDQALKKEYRPMNYYFAGDCIDQAILGLTHDYFFTVDKPIEIKEYNCTILSIENQGNLRIIRTKGTLQKADVYRRATVRLYDHKLDVIQIE